MPPFKMAATNMESYHSNRKEAMPFVFPADTAINFNQTDIIDISISGVHFKIPITHLRNYPNTKLGRLAENHNGFGCQANDLCFYRDPSMFSAMLGYYASGQFHFNNNVCQEGIRDELEFWEIEVSSIPVCCYSKFTRQTLDEDVLRELNDAHQEEEGGRATNGRSNYQAFQNIRNWRWKLLKCIEFPNCSKIGIVSISVI